MMLDYKAYEIYEDIFGDDQSVCDEVTEYPESSYLCDAIMEVADANIPSYDFDLCKVCWELNSYVEEAKFQGLLEGANDLMQILRIGAYEYYTELLYDNLDTIALNIAVEVINEEYDSENIELIDYDELVEEFENTDNNDTIDNIKDKAREFMNNLIQEYKEEEEEEEEEREE